MSLDFYKLIQLVVCLEDKCSCFIFQDFSIPVDAKCVGSEPYFVLFSSIFVSGCVHLWYSDFTKQILLYFRLRLNSCKHNGHFFSLIRSSYKKPVIFRKNGNRFAMELWIKNTFAQSIKIIAVDQCVYGFTYSWLKR